ncbi:porin [Herbaspirillum sp. SJZ107]|uniref:porin n=1 Tax=Herbaspirillum sp. SJZ107 TaxID=2572881 RepID=UPI001151DA6B|nr:porin [Herbaspirillum sp. SJZ107]TQK07844.1 putative porin [Herbaspirillum sp. SJZ107]
MNSRNIVFGLTLAAAGIQLAYAQTNVQVYGSIDVAVEHVTNANAAGDSLTRMPSLSGGLMPSRVGFRGTEELGNGLKAIFVLESGFSPDTGMMGQGNRLFGRQAWVGLAGSWGQVTVGRNYSMMYGSFADTDVMGPVQYSIGSLDGYLPNSRHDNSIAYRGAMGALAFGATYSFGRDASAAGGPTATNCGGELASDSQACRNWSAMLKYDGAAWGVIGAYDTYNGGPGAAAAFGPTSSALSDSRTHVGGYIKVNKFKFAGGYVHRKNEGNARAPTSNLSYLGVSYAYTPAWIIDAQVAHYDLKNGGDKVDFAAARIQYVLSKRTSVYLMGGYLNNDGAAAISLSAGGTVGAGLAQKGVLTGIKHTF